MSDKEQIKAIIQQYADKGKKMYSEAIDSRGSRYNAGFWDGYECCAKGLLRELEDMQEEPVSEDNTLRKASEEYLKVLSETPYNNTPITNVQTIVRELITFLDNPSKYNPNHIEETVSEDLEEAAFDNAQKNYKEGFRGAAMQAFNEGALWQKQQDQSTIELAEDHAMLAGMEKMKEQMLAKAVDGDITFDYYGDDKTYGCIAHDSFCLEDFGLKDRDKVKIIVIKED